MDMFTSYGHIKEYSKISLVILKGQNKSTDFLWLQPDCVALNS